jgi:EAL domain-containing protein (putative c-di-GMP-specific phosphodiesterase class I)
LRYLEGLAVDRIKIDPAPLDPASNSRVRLGDAVRAARSRGVVVCGERIETPDRLDAVRRVGARYGQGFLLGDPMPLERFDAELRQRPPAES